LKCKKKSKKKKILQIESFANDLRSLSSSLILFDLKALQSEKKKNQIFHEEQSTRKKRKLEKNKEKERKRNKKKKEKKKKKKKKKTKKKKKKKKKKKNLDQAKVLFCMKNDKKEVKKN